MTPIISERCGGNPFYITALIRQAMVQQERLDSEETLNELLAIDISSGFIWAELNDQVTRWIERINEYGITKWILYLAALEEGEKINLDVIKDVLVKLSRGDLIEYIEFGGWFRKLKAPILNEFLEVWGQVYVERYPHNREPR